MHLLKRILCLFPTHKVCVEHLLLKHFILKNLLKKKKEKSYHIFDILHSFWLLLCYRVKDIEAEEYMTYV